MENRVAEVYRLKKNCWLEYEQLSESGLIDLYYGDESGVSLQPAVTIRLAVRGRRGFQPRRKTAAPLTVLGCFTRTISVGRRRAKKRLTPLLWSSNWSGFLFALKTHGRCFR
jgi:hypothetical protein